ncbi:MAG: hypothetical protein ACHBNF_05845 [Chromatiales bacterium]
MNAKPLHILVVLLVTTIGDISTVFSREHLIGSQAPLSEVVRAARVAINITDELVIRDPFPSALFGFNINYASFQEELWDPGTQSLKSGVVDYLTPFTGALYRYPGGLIANGFDWSQAIGPVDKRQLQQVVAVFRRPPGKVLFGIDEYLHFLTQVNGRGLYVLNLVGVDPPPPMTEADESSLAKHTRGLAKYLNTPGRPAVRIDYYELGNELDRADYEWPHEKYIERSRATISAIRELDKNARFIAFLRDFEWTYRKAPKRDADPPERLMADVMRGLPMVDDYSLHHYYDGRHSGGACRTVPCWLDRMARSIETFKLVRDGQNPRIWVTEHARTISKEKGGGASSVQFFSTNLSSAISTADYLIALAQIPQVQGAVWHGLNARPWLLFDVPPKYPVLKPTPVYWGLRVLRKIDLPVVIGTRTYSMNVSGYAGGYDVRAVGFRDHDKQALGVWVVNRASRELIAELEYTPFKGKEVSRWHFHLAGQAGIDPDTPQLSPNLVLEPKKERAQFTDSGKTTLNLPAASISTIIFRKEISPSSSPVSIGR